MDNLHRWRQWCGLHPVKSFGDLYGIMRNKTIEVGIYDIDCLYLGT